MKRVYVSRIIEAPIDEVWEPIRDFVAVQDWFPHLTEMHIEEDREPDQVGAVRNFLNEGEPFREKLVTLSDREHHQAYTMEDLPLPVENYTGHFKLRPLTQAENPSTFIEWWNEFDVPPDRREEIVGTFQEWFDMGLRRLDDFVTSGEERG